MSDQNDQSNSSESSFDPKDLLFDAPPPPPPPAPPAYVTKNQGYRADISYNNF
jgi:hypothetical protein